MIALLALAAVAGTTSVDLAGPLGGRTVIAVECSQTRDLVAWFSEGGGKPPWMPALGPWATIGSELDPDAPITVVVQTREGGTLLAFEAGVSDPGGAPAQAAAAGIGDVVVDGIRMRGTVPLTWAPRTRALDVAGEVTSVHDGVGCTFGFDYKAMDGALPLPRLPVPVDVKLAVAELPPGGGKGLDLTLVTGDLFPGFAALLTPYDATDVPEIRADRPFPIVVQSGGTARDVAALLGLLLPGTVGDVLEAVAGTAERRIRPGHGVALAVGPGVPALMVVPMDKPRCPKRLARLVRVGARRAGWEAVKVDGRHARVTPPGRPPIHVAVAKGLIVVSPDATMVDGVLAGEGALLLPAATSPFGLRVTLGADDLVPGLPAASFEASYADGRLQLLVRPLPR